jgi:lipid II:glycine glycyltransferase (peptidoglycan interpeptide bridge formation enzyme)
MSIWQTESWQNMLIASGQAEEYFVVERDIKQLEWIEHRPIFVEKRAVSLWEYGLFVIGFEGELDIDTAESLEELCLEEKCLFVQVETIDYSGEKEGSICSWQSGYYKKFIPPYTALIDLTLWEENILAAMKPKGRYNIKVARKKWVVVEQVDSHIGNITKFHKLMSETTVRDAFAGNTLEYYKVFLESLDNAQMFFAYHEDEIIAAGIFVTQGEVMTYYYGASSSHKRNLMAPYLLQWTAIEHALRRGCKIYDFLWVAGDDEINSSLAWVTDFKMKLSPKKTLVSTARIFVNKKWKYKLIMLMRKLKK